MNAGCALELCVTRLCNFLTDVVVHNGSKMFEAGIWHAELRVPQDVRPVIGKTRFAKSTENTEQARSSLEGRPDAGAMAV